MLKTLSFHYSLGFPLFLMGFSGLRGKPVLREVNRGPLLGQAPWNPMIHFSFCSIDPDINPGKLRGRPLQPCHEEREHLPGCRQPLLGELQVATMSACFHESGCCARDEQLPFWKRAGSFPLEAHSLSLCVQGMLTCSCNVVVGSRRTFLPG